MIWPIVVFTVMFLVLSAFLVAVSFHVFRYRYNNDASVFIFVTLTIIYLLTAILIFVVFKYSNPTVSNQSTFSNFKTINKNL